MVLVLSGMWNVFCFCLSLEPDQKGLDSDALKTRGRIVIKGVVTESNLTQISQSFPCFLIKTEMEWEVSKERSKNTLFC